MITSLYLTHAHACSRARAHSIGMCHSLPPPLLQAPPSALEDRLVDWVGGDSWGRGGGRRKQPELRFIRASGAEGAGPPNDVAGYPEDYVDTHQPRATRQLTGALRMCTDAPETDEAT